MYRSLSEAAADDHRRALRDEAARAHLAALASCCARGWHRAAASLRDVIRTTQLGAGYQPPRHQQLQQPTQRGYFQPCCA